VSLDHLWAGWRRQYIETATDETQDGDACVFCRILASGQADADTLILWRGQWCLAILNAYPYTSGHLMVMPLRHVAALEDLGDEEAAELFDALRRAVVAVKSAYRPDGLNVGANLGRAGGAGIPGHLHLHVLPRWDGDTNFMTAVAEARVLPESLGETWQKLRGGFG
jgi:ATP adenylyltransferase